MSTSVDDIYFEIETCLGAAARQYAKNKHCGGCNGQKGTRYEEIFLASKIAEIASLHLGKANVAWPFISGQVDGFVDDVRVQDEEGTHYFQLKNSDSVCWISGTHPIKVDFQYQYILSEHLGEFNPKTYLVVSDLNLMKQLISHLPVEIEKHSDVHFFPYFDGIINKLVLENAELRACLTPLSKVENPNLDELEGILGVLMISAMNFPSGGKIDEIILDTKRLYPNLLRPLNIVDIDKLLTVQFRAVLDGISGLSYSVKNNFFSWSALGTSGVFSVDCEDVEFITFQNSVVNQNPTTFDDFERLLT